MKKLISIIKTYNKTPTEKVFYKKIKSRDRKWKKIISTTIFR